MKVSLFMTCLADTLYPSVGQATVTLLERLGCEVEFLEQQTCCGQMHMNTGYPALAGQLVRGFAKTYEGVEAVVLPSGSCTAMLRSHAEHVAPGVSMPPVYELSEFLVDVLGVTDVGATFEHSVTYHPTCHSLRLLGVGDRPYQLLRSVRGLQLQELTDAAQCCGFGGTFALKNSDTSGAMGHDKIATVMDTGAEFLCASDASCLMHLSGVAAKEGAPVQTVHLAEILASVA